MADHPIRAGIAGLAPGLRRQRVFEKLRFWECDALTGTPPRPSVLDSWRQEASPAHRFALVAPPAIGAAGFAATETTTSALAALADAASRLDAEALVFQTPASFTPSTGNRERMTAFFRDLAPAQLGDRTMVWEPAGLWEPEAAAGFAGTLGVCLACDPLTNDPLGPGAALWANLPTEAAYFRVKGLGLGARRFDDYALAELVELAAGYERAWIVFAHATKYPDALRLERILLDAAGEPSAD